MAYVGIDIYGRYCGTNMALFVKGISISNIHALGQACTEFQFNVNGMHILPRNTVMHMMRLIDNDVAKRRKGRRLHRRTYFTKVFLANDNSVLMYVYRDLVTHGMRMAMTS